MQKPTKVFLLVLLVILSGCASKPAPNYSPADLPKENLSFMANDIAPIIATHNPALSTVFTLPKDEFGQVLSDKLGKIGYEVMFWDQIEPPQKTETVRYTIDWVHPKTVYLSLTLNNNQRYTRTYAVDQGVITPNKTKMIGESYGR